MCLHYVDTTHMICDDVPNELITRVPTKTTTNEQRTAPPGTRYRDPIIELPVRKWMIRMMTHD